MPSEQKQLLFDEKQTTYVKNEIVDTISSVLKPKISESSFHYELKNMKIDLPKINIPSEVLLKHEVDKYRKLFQLKPQTARKSVSIKTVSCVKECMLLQNSERSEEEGLKMSAKILNFSCSKCRDSTRYSPNDLQKHFQMWHHGELPSYPCEMCSFSANDFQVFKQHRRTHRSTLVKCDICNNEIVYTLLDLTKHFASTHCVNGNFQCEKCKFSTQDVGTFVQHIHRHNESHYKCGKCHHVCVTKGELQKHLHVHSGTFPFNCQYCSYGATKREHLIRHVITLHKEHLYAKEKLEKDKNEKRMAKTSAGLKLILKRYKIGASRKTFWKRKKISNGSDRCIEKNSQELKKVNNTQAKSEDHSHLVQEHLNEEKDERLHCENNDKPAELESEKPTLLSTAQSNRDESEGSGFTSGFLKTVVQGPTVLTVKNNRITIPANYSAKFMGFKMVDGKQHIVIKLLPTNKQNFYSPGSQSGAAKDNTANLQPQTLDTTGFLTGVTAELSDTVYMKTTTPFSCSSPLFSGKVTSGKEMTLLSQMSKMLQTVEDEKSVSSLPTSELVTISGNLTTKAETRDSVDLRGSSITQSHPEVSGTAIKSPDKVNCNTKPNAYSSGDMHNYCINYVNSELPVESSNQGSLPFHNYSKVNNSNKRRRFSGTAVCENPQRESSSSKTVVQQPINESYLSLVRKESSNPDSLLASVSLSHTKDGTFKAQAEIEEHCVSEGQNIDRQNLYTNESKNLESMSGKSKWNDISSDESLVMPRITSVFSLQSKQASEFLPPEVNQLLQDVLKVKSDVKQDPSNNPNNDLPLCCDQSFQKHAGEGKIVESSKDFKIQGIIPVPPGSVPTHDLNLKCSGKEKQALSVSNEVRDLEKKPRISGIGTLLKTQSDAIITQQLVKDKLRATTQNLSSLHRQTPLLNSEPKKAIFVQTPKGFFVPLHFANKPGLHVVSGRPLPLVNAQGVPASLLLSKKPGMILTFNNRKLEGVSAVKTENASACGTTTKEPCTPFLKVEPNSNCLTPALCSSIGSCLSMKSSSENTLPLKGPYVIKTSAGSSVKAVPTPNITSEHPGTKLNILDSGKQQNEIFPKPPLYTLLPDGKQAVFFKCVMPNKTELLKPKLVQSSSYYQNIQPKKPEGTPQKILLKIFNPVLNVTAANLLVSNSASSLQKDSVPSSHTTRGEQKEPESSRDALPLLDDMMPANEIVITSAMCPESSEQQVCITDHSKARVLRCKTNCTIERNFNRKKTSKKNVARIETHVRSKDSETAFVSRNRNCKRKCRDSYQEPPRKKATLHRKCKEKAKPEDVPDSFEFSRPRLSKDSVRILQLFPFSSKQLVKCPRRNQPVVVLNHPDVDTPEVANVMKTIAKYNGRVLKVSLSKRTINALLKPVCCNPSKATYDDFPKRHQPFKPVSSVKERFVLKLTLKKTSKNNYQIVKTTSENVLKAKFNCWFCGRVFDNQDAWAGHGQRHLMEATRDWNILE
ncbi:hypothetical protein MC885_014277 [Smutsia gigantea]|nr:hypothetical protein MC885_014277 [Smutsia gigantea]